MSNERVVTAVTTALTEAQRVNERTNAFITICNDEALNAARAIPTDAPLGGEPIVVKDNIATKGIRTTAGSKALADYVPLTDATVVERLQNAGAVVVAKANLDEFGMGATGENSAFGSTAHPFDDTLVPGGSSSGSAVAVATGVVRVALGTDTGGSVRQPAAFCRIYGYKPTYGLIPRTGVIPYTSSLDSVGVFGASIDDIARVVPYIVGRDGHDELVTVDAWDDLPPPQTERATLGVVKQFSDYGDAEFQHWFAEQLEHLSETFNITTVDIPLAAHTSALYAAIANAEGVSNLARYTGMLFGSHTAPESAGQVHAITENRTALLGSEVKKRLLVGMHVTAAEQIATLYERAVRARANLREEVRHALAGITALITPTVSHDPFTLGADRTVTPLPHTLSDRMLQLANLAGCCAISLPGSGKQYRGIQLVGAGGADRQLLHLANDVNAQVRRSPNV